MQFSCDSLRAIRLERGETQEEFAEFLNHHLDRHYRKTRISRWEKGAEDIPQNVALFLMGRQTMSKIKTTVIAIANQKGGVGKTTTAVNLGYALARAGYRSLVVDADPQANATVHLGLNPFELNQKGQTLYQVLLKDMPFGEIIKPVSEDAPLFLAPSSLTLAAADTELVAEPGGAFVLREKLQSIRDEFTFVIVDCPPHLGLLTVNALSAADQVLIPTQTELLSAMGIPLLLETIDKICRRSNPALRIFGILPTMYSPRQTQDKATLAELQQLYGSRTRIFPEVVRTTVYAQSAAAGRPTLEAAPQALGIEAYQTLAAELIAVVKKQSGEAAHGA